MLGGWSGSSPGAGAKRRPVGSGLLVVEARYLSPLLRTFQNDLMKAADVALSLMARRTRARMDRGFMRDGFIPLGAHGKACSRGFLRPDASKACRRRGTFSPLQPADGISETLEHGVSAQSVVNDAIFRKVLDNPCGVRSTKQWHSTLTEEPPVTAALS